MLLSDDNFQFGLAIANRLNELRVPAKFFTQLRMDSFLHKGYILKVERFKNGPDCITLWHKKTGKLL